MLAQDPPTSAISSSAASCFNNIWVNASAGSGKTKFLIDRLLLLLLQGCKADRVVCITYTKAAASEIEHRLISTLESFSKQTDDELAPILSKILNTSPSSEQIKKAKNLFYETLDLPFGFQINTIHGFCQNILTTFPVEAGLHVDFKIIDNQTKEELIKQAYSKLFKHPIPEYIDQHTKLLLTHTGEEKLRSLFNHLFDERSCIKHILSEHKNIENYKVFLIKNLIKKSYQTVSIHEINNTINILCDATSTQDILVKNDLLEFLKSQALTPSVWLTQSGEIKKRLLSTAYFKNFPQLETTINLLAENAYQQQNNHKNQLIIDQTCALLSLSIYFFENYEKLKQSLKLVDFDDLLYKVNQLLSDENLSAWVFQKLEHRIDHILIDEAQDTSPEQWQFIIKLINELITPDNPTRTIFVVGDMKQSIYSFQGAEPKLFNDLEPHFRQHFEQQNRAWNYVNLHQSYRTTPAILKVVDKVFEKHHHGVRDQNKNLTHDAFRKEALGKVELWPLVKQNNNNKTERSFLPIERIEAVSAYKQLASDIAEKVLNILNSKTILPSKNRPPKASDILILVQKRTAIVPLLHEELAKLNIPTAGADQVSLKDHPAIQDLYALACWLNLPEDDYTLACILKSPLVCNGWGISEDLLFELCHQRNETLWNSISEKSVSNPVVNEIYEFLKNLLSKVDYASPFELFHSVIISKRPLLYKRFGQHCEDILQSFLDIIIKFESENIPTLHGFISFFEKNDNFVIKRNLATTNNAGLRIMTVHGSKGLQAPIVIIADSTETPSLRQDLSIYSKYNNLWIIKPTSLESTPTIDDLKEQIYIETLEEHRRLLYVAMTRAQDHLYIGGIERSNNSEHSWHNIIQNTLAELTEGSPQSGYVYPKNYTNLSNFPLESPIIENDYPQPFWLHEDFYNPLTKPQQNKQPLLPSAERGIEIHKLFELTSGMNRDEGNAFLTNIFKNVHPYCNMPQQDQQKIMAVFNIPGIEIFFSNQAIAEVELISDEQLIRIDRLVVTNNEVLILDIKTSINPPQTKHDVSHDIKQQLQKYGDLLGKIYPSHTIRTFLLWVESAHLMETT